MAVIQISRRADPDADLGEDLLAVLPALELDYRETEGTLVATTSGTVDEFEDNLDDLMPDWRDRYQLQEVAD